MDLFAPFSFRPDLDVSPSWSEWLSIALRSDKDSVPLPPSGFDQQLRVLSSHGVLPLLYIRLRDEALWLDLPAQMRAALADAFETSAARSFLLEAELVRIGQICPGLALLKGAALGQTVYHNSALRPVSDIDVLVQREDVDGVRDRLVTMGYRPVGIAGHGRLGRWVRSYRAELPLIGTVAGCGQLLVELHWALVEIPYYVTQVPTQDIWTSTAAAPALPAYVIPRPAVLLAHACAHLAMHHSRDLRLIWLVDLDRLARWDQMDWDELLQIAERWKLGPTLHSGLTVVGRWLNTPTPPSVLERLSQLANDRIATSSWGLGDEAEGRALRRAIVTMTALPPREAGRYAAWLGMRTILRPLEGLLLARQARSQ